jgi:hypothetical protein
MDIRKLLDIINENSKPKPAQKSLLKGVEVMSLPQFVAQQTNEGQLDEDDPQKFLGATYRKPSDDEMKGYLGRIVDKKKEKRDKFNLPYIHRSNVLPIIYKPSDGGEISAIPGTNDYEFNLEAMKKLFTTRPEYILKQNDKMKHSDGTTSIFFNIGLPAMNGMVVDESTNEFVIINTCPGAGACKTFCFVGKGGYVQYSPPSTHMTRNLNFLINDPQGWSNMLKSEISQLQDKYSKKGSQLVIRWHDAGDFFSDAYKDVAFDVAKSFPNVQFYAYTKIASIATGKAPDNFIFNFSKGALRSQEKQVDFTKTKHSAVIDEPIFKDLVKRVTYPDLDKSGKQKIDKKTGEPKTFTKLEYKGPAQIKTLKDRIAKAYNLDPNSILTYDEMLKMPKGQPLAYNVIIKPGDGDIAATRRDVLGSLLLIH